MKEELLKKLSSEDRMEVREAIESLADYPEEDVVEAIVQTLKRVKSKAVLEAGKNTLYSFEKIKEKVCEHVIELFKIEEPKLRHAAIDIMSYHGNACLEVIDKHLLSNPDYNMRKFGLDILANIQSEEALEKIIGMLSDENPNVKFTALEYLRNFSDFKDKVVEGVLKALPEVKDLYGLTTLASTVIYGNFRDERLCEPLKEKLKEFNNPMERHWIYKVLVFLKAKDVYQEAIENAKKIGMEHDIRKDIEIFDAEGE